MATFFIPFSLLLAVAFGKEGFDDFQRMKKDKIMNQSIYMYIISWLLIEI
jgi:hypothetical protein